MEVRQISGEDIDAIVDLHISVMPKSINSLLGHHHLKMIYSASISNNRYFGYIAYDADSKILAFSGASNSYRELSDSLRGAYNVKMFLQICKLVVKGNTREIVRAVLGAFYLTWRPHDMYISSWCSTATLQGGIATGIVFRKVLEVNDFEGKVIFAEILSENIRLLDFYEKIGFQKVLSVAGSAIMRKVVY